MAAHSAMIEDGRAQIRFPQNDHHGNGGQDQRAQDAGPGLQAVLVARDIVGQNQDEGNLGHFRGLEGERPDLDPARGAECPRAHQFHVQQQQDDADEQDPRQSAPEMVVDDGGEEQDAQPDQREQRLALGRIGQARRCRPPPNESSRCRRSSAGRCFPTARNQNAANVASQTRGALRGCAFDARGRAGGCRP